MYRLLVLYYGMNKEGNMKNLNDEKFLDTITYTMGGVQTVNRYYDDYSGQNIKWGSENGFTRNRRKYTKWYTDNTLDKIFIELAKNN